MEEKNDNFIIFSIIRLLLPRSLPSNISGGGYSISGCTGSLGMSKESKAFEPDALCPLWDCPPWNCGGGGGLCGGGPDAGRVAALK